MDNLKYLWLGIIFLSIASCVNTCRLNSMEEEVKGRYDGHDFAIVKLEQQVHKLNKIVQPEKWNVK